jgi:hypothetical protein
MKTKTVYICEICNGEYETRKEAMACERQVFPKPEYKKGALVTVQKYFGWFDGDPRWVLNLKQMGEGPPGHLPGAKHRHNCFDVCCNYLFAWEIVDVRTGEHGDSVFYTVDTKALKEGRRSVVPPFDVLRKLTPAEFARLQR